MSTIRMDSLLPGLVARRWVTGAKVTGAFVEVGVGGTWAFAVKGRSELVKTHAAAG